MTPKSEFYHDQRAGKISFADYYKESYGINVSDFKQSLIEVTLRKEKIINKEGNMIKRDIIGYLIPEFVYLTGMRKEQKADFNTMKKISKYTKFEPDERM